MRRQDFYYDLPEELIAQRPLPERRAARLLAVDIGRAALADRVIANLPELVRAGDLLVMNDTRVIPARLYGTKDTGGRVELLLERIVSNTQALAHIRASKAPKPGSQVFIEGQVPWRVVAKQADGLTLLECQNGEPLTAVIERHGHLPLPPYITRADDAGDWERYQTVYARNPGAVAAPTAGLHLDAALLGTLHALGVTTAFVTLHVGAGTFQPVRNDDLALHHMHAEWLEVGAETVTAIRRTRAEGGRVIAIGTTSVRALETAAQAGEIAPYIGDTRLFITPGYRFRVVNALLTNFHLPESTLLMLVAALAGYDTVMRAYRHAVAARYRFFSYGDAMWLA